MTPAELRRAADRCVACAACRSGCPTFDATLEEGRSGRGRVELVRSALDGALDPGTDRFFELISSCSRCGYCAKICPVDIPVVDVIDAGRSMSLAARGTRPEALPLRPGFAEARSAGRRDAEWLLRRAGRPVADVDDPVAWSAALEAGGFDGPFLLSALPGPIIVHEPCAGRYGAAGSTAVLRLLLSAGADARAFAGAACCGGAEPFRTEAPELASALGRRAAEAAGGMNARTLVSSDPGCLIQLDGFFAGEGARSTVVVHAATALRRITDPSYAP